MMRRFDPFDDMLSLRDAMQQLMEDAVITPGRSSSTGSMGMPLDLHETQDSFIVEAVLPGVQPDDVDITVQDNVLHINAETRREQTSQPGSTHRQERYYGRFTRAISLPRQVNPDQIHATLEHGILRLNIPKAEQAKPRKITVNVGTQAQGQPQNVATPGAQSQPASSASSQIDQGQMPEQERQVGG